MKDIIHKKSKSITSILFLVVFLSSLLILPVYPVKTAESSGPMVWVLTETLVNPNDEQLEFHGGGTTPGYFGEARFKGKFTKYGVTETSFRIDDRWVDHGYEHHNVTIETYFEKPPLKITPGETIELIAGFSHSGTAEDAGISVGFLYDSESVNIQADFTFDNTFIYAPWAEGFDDITEETYTFDVPPATSGSEIEIYAGLWNAPPCTVIWKYKAQEAQPDAGELGEAEEAGEQQDVAEMADNTPATGSGQDVAPGKLAGHVLALTGEVTVVSRNGEHHPLKRGDPVFLGSCVSTGPWGRVRIRMNDLQVDGEWLDRSEPGSDARLREAYKSEPSQGGPRYIHHLTGPSYLNIGTNSEMCFYTLAIDFGDPPRSSGLVELLLGTLRPVIRGLKTNSSFSVRAGIAICGIRGSDVYISYDPEADLVDVMVIEGHMDVTSEVTGETISMSDHQHVIVDKGTIVNLGDLKQETWDAIMEERGLRDEDFPDADVEWPSDLEEPTIEEPTLDAEAPGFKQEEPAPGLTESLPVTESVFVLCGVLLCGATIIAILAAVIFLVRRRSKHKPEDDA